MAKFNLNRLKSAILKEFGGYISESGERAMEIIDQSVYTGKGDPGQWSPDALAVIHCESGVPHGYYNHYIGERWYKVGDELDVIIEDYNCAVKCVYEL